jgi:hypothetical protein
MPTMRMNLLGNLLSEHDARLSERFADQLATMTDAQKNALLWRIDAEQGVAAAQSAENGMVVVYEELCRDPMGVAQQVFSHFGIGFHDQVKEFIEVSCNPKPGTRVRYSEWATNSYFSIFRDPLQSMNGWKKHLTSAQIAEILAVVADSEAYARFHSRGIWE